jgi:hypothetical protein
MVMSNSLISVENFSFFHFFIFSFSDCRLPQQACKLRADDDVNEPMSVGANGMAVSSQ